MKTESAFGLREQLSDDHPARRRHNHVRAPNMTQWRPWWHIENGDGTYRLQVAMPGVAASGVEISLDRNQLVITGSRAVPESPSSKRWVLERAERDYRLALRLEVEVDEDNIIWEMNDGMLILSLPVKGG